MKVEVKDDRVEVQLEQKMLTYDLKEWSEKQMFFEEQERLEEWKIDLIKNHGVDADEL